MNAAAEKVRAPTWLELEAVIPLFSTQPGVTSVESLTSLSYDTIAREYPELVVKISPRRRGMKLKNALKIAAGGEITIGAKKGAEETQSELTKAKQEALQALNVLDAIESAKAQSVPVAEAIKSGGAA